MCAPNRRVDAYNKAAGRELYIVADGLRIAKRGQIGTPHAQTWISLEAGWRVFSDKKFKDTPSNIPR